MTIDKSTKQPYYKFSNLENVINALAALLIFEEVLCNKKFESKGYYDNRDFYSRIFSMGFNKNTIN
ncbi:MAG: hypothetical protein FWE36_00080 [Erysipelotrichales bacterium]|nr:hypothetical protein [Erysipelotrichales bacterium]